MFQTLKNAWRTLELRNKLIFTFIILVLYRLGASIPVPYVSGDAINMQGIMQLFNLMSGGALSQATLFALGVSPYITSSIVIQLLTVAIPALQKWSQDGENGRKKINALTRVITLALAVITSFGYVTLLQRSNALITPENANLVWFRNLVMIACYCAGAMLVMWLAEKINESGIGNGISMILFANIIAGFRTQITHLYNLAFPTTGFNWVGLVFAIGIILVTVAFIVLIVVVTDAERRIPIQYAKRVVGRKMYGGQNTNLPIKVNMSGVMPIIFANSIVAIPATIAGFISNQDNWFVKFVNGWFNQFRWPYLIVFLVLLIAFAYFYIAISFNPIEVANNIKNNGGAIPGIRSGRPTVEYITKILNRITLVGALFVAIIAVVPMIAVVIEVAVNPAIADPTSGVTGIFAPVAFGGSSLMIVIGVALETVRELEAQLTLRNYKGFLD